MAGELLAIAATQVERAGADFLLIGTNTMHKVAHQVEAALSIPLLHLADATAQRIRAAGITTVGLLGPQFTMEQDFYKHHLEQHGLTVRVPPTSNRAIVHRVIYDELCLSTVNNSSRQEFLRIIQDLYVAGAEGIIKSCTEIVMLVQQSHTEIPLFDTTAIHAQVAVAAAVQDFDGQTK